MVFIQINMLVVNGFIEVVCVGEFGKGFVVVVIDICNLVYDLVGNVDNIKDLVKVVQDQIVVVECDLEEIVDVVIGEVEKVKVIISVLVSIESDVVVVE